VLAKWHASHIPPCPIVASKVVSVQLSALEGIPHESNILIGVQFAFYGSEPLFCLWSSHFDGSTEPCSPHNYFHRTLSSKIIKHNQTATSKKYQSSEVRDLVSYVLSRACELIVGERLTTLPRTDQDEDDGHSQTGLISIAEVGEGHCSRMPHVCSFTIIPDDGVILPPDGGGGRRWSSFLRITS
jgi:hypothetical protein